MTGFGAPTKPTTMSVGLRYGVFLGVFGIVSFLAFTLSGMNITDGVGAWLNRILSFAATAFVLYLGASYFKTNGDGYMSFGQGFGMGFWTTLTSSAMTSVFLYIYIKFIDSGFIDMIKDKAIQDMQDKGMSEQQIEQGMKFASMFMSPEAMLIFGLIGGVFFGLVIALLVSIFTQVKNPDAIPN